MAGSTITREKPDRAKTAGRVNHALREIYVGRAAKTAEPVVIETDDLSREMELGRSSRATGFAGRVYLVWMAHSDGGGCSRDPVKDPHEDLAYVGKTVRDLTLRWLEHLAPGKIDGSTGERRKNNSAVYRNRARVTGFSADPRVYDSPEALALAEGRAIKSLWPAWNIQEQDRRNPHTRATRAYRRPDRLAPLIGLASVLWGLLWAIVTGGLMWIVLGAPGVMNGGSNAAWYWIAACPLIALYLVNGTAFRHARRMSRRRR